MPYTYRLHHEAVVRGTTTVTSSTKLSVDEIQNLINDGELTPGQFNIEPSDDYPIVYGELLGISGDEQCDCC